MTQYTLHTQIDITATFTQVSDGAAVDPTTVVFQIQEPDGTITTKTYPTDGDVTKSATGIYVYGFTPTQEGVHTYRIYGTGTVPVGSLDAEFAVVETVFE